MLDLASKDMFISTTDDPRLTVRPELLTLAEYQPVPTPAQVAAELGLPLDAILKLDANENPYGAPPGVAAALATLDPSRYPDADAGELRAALAAYTEQPVERIVCGNGSDELLELLCRLFIAPGDTVITAEPTFGMYAIAARQHGAQVRDVPRDRATFAVDSAGVIRATAAPGVRLIFLCSPNNPTGTVLPAVDLCAILEAAPCPVVLDEAYAEFAGVGALHLLAAYPHLIILRTLSKLGGLAGLRLGYALAGPPIVRALWRVKAPYNVNSAAQVAGVAALREWPWIADKLARIQAGRTTLTAGLGAISGLHVYPSAANFLLLRVAGGQPAADALYTGLRACGILIRRYGPGPLAGCLRLSVGTEAQNARLVAEVQRLCLTP